MRDDATPRSGTGLTVALSAVALLALVGPLAPSARAQARVVPADHWMGADKVKHFVASFVIQSVGYAALRTANVPHGGALGGAAAATAAVGLWKERYDRGHTGLFSRRDLVWDALGIVAASAVLAHAER